MDRGVVRELAWKKDPLPLDGLAFDCRRKHNGRLNRVLTELAGTQIDPLPGMASLAGLGWNKIPICRAARDTYARGAVISNRRFSKVASATPLVKGSVIAR